MSIPEGSPPGLRGGRRIVWPEDPTREELAADWTLSQADQDEILLCRGEASRRRFATQLCVLRKWGRLLEAHDEVPLDYVNYLARQLELEPLLVCDEPVSEPTENAQKERILTYLGYRRWEDIEAELERWLKEHVEEWPEPQLLRRAYEYLRHERVVLPSSMALERLVRGVVSRSRDRVYEQILQRIPLHLCRAFDELLETSQQDPRSSFFRIKDYPDDPLAQDILECLEYFERLQAMELEQIDLRGLALHQVGPLYQQARRLDASDLKRLGPARRYALLACFLLETRKTLLDHLVRMNDKLLSGKWREAKNKFENKVREVRRRFRKGLPTACSVLEVLIREETPRESILDALFEHIGVDAMRASLASCQEFQQLEEHGTYREFVGRLSYLRRYLPAFYLLPLRAEPGSEPILAGIDFLRELDANRTPGLPLHAPMGFVSTAWRGRIESEQGRLRRQLWEIALAFTVRDKLRSGDLYLPGSRDHVSFSNLVYDEERWQQERGQAYAELALNPAADQQLALLQRTLEEVAGHAATGMARNPFASVENGQLRLKRKDALEVTPPLAQLRTTLHGSLAPVRIEDLLRQVDHWCDFTGQLTALPGYQPRSVMPVETLLASLIAHGTNLGIATMGQSTEGIATDMLSTATRWYLREDTIKAAMAVLVDFHHRIGLSRVWGDGTSSTSDGQRFGIRGRSVLGSFYPRYFGYYDRAITIYTHLSDQHSVFATQAISCEPHESLYLLDGLLDNNTILRLGRHTSDTHGYTDHIFGLCYLLGYTFMPRIKDLKDKRLYKMSRDADYGCLEPLFHGVAADVDLIPEQWDPLVRMVASLRNRTSPAHLVVQRLATGSPPDRLSRALTALGQICKTIHILRYIQDEALRQWIQILLNRGEFRHALAKAIFFANQGIFRSGDYEEIMNKASCLSLLCNAILVWNTVHMALQVDRMRSAGLSIPDERLARVSPLAHSHVIPNGTYFFDRPIQGVNIAHNMLF